DRAAQTGRDRSDPQGLHRDRACQPRLGRAARAAHRYRSYATAPRWRRSDPACRHGAVAALRRHQHRFSRDRLRPRPHRRDRRQAARRLMISWATIAPALTASFLASLVEAVEALTVVLAVGIVRGWRPAALGTAAALALLAVLVLALGPLLDRVPLHVLQ